MGNNKRPFRCPKNVMAGPAAKQFIEHWIDLEEFAFGDGREETYPIEEIQQLNLRRAPKLSDEAGDGS